MSLALRAAALLKTAVLPFWPPQAAEGTAKLPPSDFSKTSAALEPAPQREHLPPMPIYEYAPIDPPGCALCCYGFDVLQRLADAPLTRCLACGTPVHRVIGAAQVIAGHAHLLREQHVAKHGFTQYRRVGNGKDEKTAGKGPDTISGN